MGAPPDSIISPEDTLRTSGVCPRARGRVIPPGEPATGRQPEETSPRAATQRTPIAFRWGSTLRCDSSVSLPAAPFTRFSCWLFSGRMKILVDPFSHQATRRHVFRCHPFRARCQGRPSWSRACAEVRRASVGSRGRGAGPRVRSRSALLNNFLSQTYCSLNFVQPGCTYLKKKQKTKNKLVPN